MSTTTTAASTPSSVHNKDLLDHFVLDRIGYRARRLAVQFNLDDGRQDDLRQDMVAEVLRAATRFDPTRTTWHTFACRVLDRLVKHIARAESLRRVREADGLPHDPCSAEGVPAVLAAMVDPRDDLADLELRLDVDHVLASMPPRLRQACELLREYSPPEVARMMGIHRNSIYRLVARARRYFEEAGLGPSEISAANAALSQM